MSNPENTQRFLSKQPASSSIGRFAEGFAAPIQGFKFLNSQRQLWRLAVLPILFNLLITGLIFFVLVAMIGWFATEVHPWLTEGLSDGWWLVVLIGEVLAVLLLLAVCAVASVVIWKVLSGVLCGYFYGKLAEEVEYLLGVEEGTLRSISWQHELFDTLLGLTLLIVANLAFLCLGIIPFIGGILALTCSFTFAWYLLGVDHFGFSLSLRGVRRWDQFVFGRRNWAHTLGMGSVVFVFQLIPFVGAVILTTAVVGAVILHRRITIPDRP